MEEFLDLVGEAADAEEGGEEADEDGDGGDQGGFDEAGDPAGAAAGEGDFDPDTIDALLVEAKSSGTPLDGAEGLLTQLTKAVLERALAEEMTEHLGYGHGDPAGNGSGNSRNGHSEKTVSTTTGSVRRAVPRDRNGSFEPQIVPKGARRIGRIDEMILSLYSRE